MSLQKNKKENVLAWFVLTINYFFFSIFSWSGRECRPRYSVRTFCVNLQSWFLRWSKPMSILTISCDRLTTVWILSLKGLIHLERLQSGMAAKALLIILRLLTDVHVLHMDLMSCCWWAKGLILIWVGDSIDSAVLVERVTTGSILPEVGDFCRAR